MRVVAFVPNYPPFSRVGAWLATHELLLGLASRGHDVRVRTTMGYESGSHDGFDVRPVGYDFAPHAKSADLVLSHAGDMYAKQIDFVSEGIPSVKVVHSLTGAPEPTADLVVFNSEATREAAGWSVDSIVVRPRTRPRKHRVDRLGDRVTLVNMSTEKGGQVLRRIAARDRLRKFLGVIGGHGSRFAFRSKSRI